ncbi:MAG: hypothetical protein ACJAQT_004149 [Akkermansiaceae bacterium]|jgi:hypothetical protein
MRTVWASELKKPEIPEEICVKARLALGFLLSKYSRPGIPGA